MTNTLKEENFTYTEFKNSLKGFSNFINKFEYIDKGMARAEVDWVISNIGMPNNLTIMIGYGLFTQKDTLNLRLENAKLKNMNEKYLASIEKDLNDIKDQIKDFLEKYYWVD